MVACSSCVILTRMPAVRRSSGFFGWAADAFGCGHGVVSFNCSGQWRVVSGQLRSLGRLLAG